MNIPKGGYVAIAIQRQGGSCCYCRRPFKKNNYHHPLRATKEHITRQADGGTNIPDNYAAAHKWCNDRRGAINWLLYASVMQREFDEALIAFPEETAYIEKMRRKYIEGNWVPSK